MCFFSENNAATECPDAKLVDAALEKFNKTMVAEENSNN